MSKICTGCHERKPLTEFYMKRAWRRPDDGLAHYRSYCKACWQKRNGKYIKVSRARYPDKEKARHEVYRAVKKGLVTRKACEVCSDEKAYAHHDDYSKPLAVRWLCRGHHEDLHHERSFR